TPGHQFARRESVDPGWVETAAGIPRNREPHVPVRVDGIGMARILNHQRWLRWLLPGLEVKRWLLLLTLAILIIDLGASYALKSLYSEVTFPGYVATLTLQFVPKAI